VVVIHGDRHIRIWVRVHGKLHSGTASLEVLLTNRVANIHGFAKNAAVTRGDVADFGVRGCKRWEDKLRKKPEQHREIRRKQAIFVLLEQRSSEMQHNCTRANELVAYLMGEKVLSSAAAINRVVLDHMADQFLV
jgi:hypothetical protein